MNANICRENNNNNNNHNNIATWIFWGLYHHCPRGLIEADETFTVLGGAGSANTSLGCFSCAYQAWICQEKILQDPWGQAVSAAFAGVMLSDAASLHWTLPEASAVDALCWGCSCGWADWAWGCASPKILRSLLYNSPFTLKHAESLPQAMVCLAEVFFSGTCCVLLVGKTLLGVGVGRGVCCWSKSHRGFVLFIGLVCPWQRGFVALIIMSLWGLSGLA